MGVDSPSFLTDVDYLEGSRLGVEFRGMLNVASVLKEFTVSQVKTETLKFRIVKEH